MVAVAQDHAREVVAPALLEVVFVAVLELALFPLVEGFINDVSIGTAVAAAVTVTTPLTPCIVISNRSANQVIATIDYLFVQQTRA